MIRISRLRAALSQAATGPLVCLPGLICLLSLLATDAGARSPEAVADEFEIQFRQGAASNNYPAAGLAIVTRDRVLKLIAIGHQDASRKTPVDLETIFRLASVSKTFAAGAVGLLADEGLLAWDDPVTQFEPQFQIKGGQGNEVRIRHLLEHSSGLVPHAYDNLIEDGVPRNRIVNRLSELDPVCSPGSCYGYQNVVFSLLEPAVEQAAAQSYPQWVQRRIFDPLEMQNASIGFEAFEANPNHALPHVRARGRWYPVNVEPNYYALPAAAGVNASITDVSRWLQAQLGARPDVISPDLIAYLTTPRMRTRGQITRRYWRGLIDDAHYGMGWRIYDLDGLQVVYHGGWVEGFRADVAFSPELNLGIAILLNAEANSLSELSSDFWRLAKTVDRQ